jgi:hypothetical protein
LGLSALIGQGVAAEDKEQEYQSAPHAHDGSDGMAQITLKPLIAQSATEMAI